jgi:hypothetical protein
LTASFGRDVEAVNRRRRVSMPQTVRRGLGAALPRVLARYRIQVLFWFVVWGHASGLKYAFESEKLCHVAWSLNKAI